ncbi:2-succinyl-6-hydroxy-2,4-cyclohexadiene-1-carboxylate synthase [Terrilactibacillus sp. BCM23-1]|uniref:Putative 2-succinyl-6-hydroxy-2,4-cyclohexadiene-1-carboxylate synthase n=1 Tax=Terrilactibacillus tamarindi TaxID=2599694 RepID=A0A6N8CLS4_9BACI|nr:2-succinyl-6-hydroxy-2,4-cyclohexadiene-1-carboxylate synthase [Terrilactibacillus tamarindi]MTT30518.1 2-succinyl-6-hydroxy-2,4-cyclohexadiene-1-carboxylate synthase [Terrilactibacillus tamarindi]
MIQFIENMGVQHAVNIHGDKSHPPLLLLHGFTGTMETWQPFIDQWSKRFYTIQIDIVGHGETISPDDVSYYAMDHEAASIIRLLDKLEVSTTHIVGYSMGGRLALYLKYAYPHRVDHVLLESSSPGLDSESEREKRRKSDHQLAVRLQKESIESFVDFWENIPLFHTQKRLSNRAQLKIRKERCSQQGGRLSLSLMGMGTGQQVNLWPYLPKIHHLFLVTGTLDSKFMNINRKMYEMLPNTKWFSMKNVGHAVHIEVPSLFSRLVYDRFYNEIKGNTGQENKNSKKMFTELESEDIK